MAINFSGEFTTPRSPDEVFDFLSDPSKFAPLLPDYQSMSMQDASHFTVKVKVGVGNIRGSAELKMELTEAVKPQRAQYKGQGTAVGSQVNVVAGFDLEPNGSTTKVVWKGETSIFGKLASMAGGMLEPLGRKNIQKLIEGLPAMPANNDDNAHANADTRSAAMPLSSVMRALSTTARMRRPMALNRNSAPSASVAMVATPMATSSSRLNR